MRIIIAGIAFVSYLAAIYFVLKYVERGIAYDICFAMSIVVTVINWSIFAWRSNDEET